VNNRKGIYNYLDFFGDICMYMYFVNSETFYIS